MCLRNNCNMSRRFWGIALAFAVLVGPLAHTAPAYSANGADFNAGSIMSDAVFYDSGSMSASQIQTFLESKVSRCIPGFTCLRDFRVTTPNKPATSRCSAYSGAENQSAASIIFDVSQRCGINPQVLIVLLEKEQSLITSNAPSATRYRSATGYGCPDTAPCDSEYYGFFNQVYNAASQFKNYRANPTSFRYRAGQINTVQWHPNAACGSSQIFIENQATAGLYNYTPYRPNAAALANLYGSGDSCSSYGNRNFWRIFSDWFGDPSGGSNLIASRSDGKVYLVSAATRHHIPNPTVLERYRSLFPIRWVDESYFAGLSSGPPAGDIVRDPSSGNVYLLSDGGKAQFPTCELVSAFGYSCPDAISLGMNLLSKFPTRQQVSPFVKAVGQQEVYLLEGNSKRWVTGLDVLIGLNGGAFPSITSTPPEFINSKSTGSPLLSPGRLYKGPNSPQIFLINGSSEKIPVDSFDVSVSLGFGSQWRQIQTELLDGYPTAQLPLSNLIECDGQTYVGSMGSIVRLQQPQNVGGPISKIDRSACSVLPRSAQAIEHSLLVRDPNRSEIYLVQGGKRHHVLTGSALAGFFPDGNARVLLVHDRAQSQWPVETPIRLAPGRLFKEEQSPEIFLIDGFSRKVYVSSFDVASNLGLTSFQTLPSGELASFERGNQPLQNFVQCGARSFAGDAGRLTAIDDFSSSGVAVTTLDAMTCSGLAQSGKTVRGSILVGALNQSEIYLLQSGQRRWITSMGVLNSVTASPTVLRVPETILRSIAAGSNLSLPLAALVRNSQTGEIFVVLSPSAKAYVSSQDVLIDIGLDERFTNYSAVEMNTVQSTGSPLSPVVRCGDSLFVSSNGALMKIPNAAGSIDTATSLPASICSKLKFANEISAPVFVKSNSSPDIFMLSAGQRKYVPTVDKLIQLNGGAMPPNSSFVVLRPGSLGTIPLGPNA